jgi:hypothetical protein
MGVSVILLPLTAEFLAEEGVSEWLEDLEIARPTSIILSRKPTYREVKYCLSEMKTCHVSFYHRAIIIESPTLTVDGEEYEIEQYAELHVVPDENDDMPVKSFVVERYADILRDLFQLIANRCGTYLILGNGEPDYFVTPQITDS